MPDFPDFKDTFSITKEYFDANKEIIIDKLNIIFQENKSEIIESLERQKKSEPEMREKFKHEGKNEYEIHEELKKYYFIGREWKAAEHTKLVIERWQIRLVHDFKPYMSLIGIIRGVILRKIHEVFGIDCGNHSEMLRFLVKMYLFPIDLEKKKQYRTVMIPVFKEELTSLREYSHELKALKFRSREQEKKMLDLSEQMNTMLIKRDEYLPELWKSEYKNELLRKGCFSEKFFDANPDYIAELQSCGKECWQAGLESRSFSKAFLYKHNLRYQDGVRWQAIPGTKIGEIKWLQLQHLHPTIEEVIKEKDTILKRGY